MMSGPGPTVGGIFKQCVWHTCMNVNGYASVLS